MLFHSGQGAGQFGNSPPLIQYLAAYNQSTSASSVNIGTASTTRSIVVVATGYHTTGSTGISAITINGTSCMRINSYNLSSYSGFVGIGAIGVPSGTTTNISLTVGAYTGLAFTVFSITKKLPINYVAATNTGVPTGASFTHSLTTSSPVTRKIVFSGISSYAGGATNATSSLDATYINSYGSYVFGSAYKNITSVNPFSLTWFAPADWSTLGHTVSSLAIGF